MSVVALHVGIVIAAAPDAAEFPPQGERDDGEYDDGGEAGHEISFRF